MALFRGVNVGGRNRLPMTVLAAMFEDAGSPDAQTYIQSGNVAFRARRSDAARIAEDVSARIEAAVGARAPVVVRSAAEMAAVLKANPFLGSGIDERALHVGFLRDRPLPARVAELDSQRSPPDRFALSGREVFLHLPSGVARTKLTNAYFENALKTTATFRNWRTVRKLAAMAGA